MKMKRRTFLSAAPLLAQPPAVRSASTDCEAAALPDLEKLRAQYHYDLFEDFLPFMDRYVIDHEYGGFLCGTDRDGARVNTWKATWYEGRGIWVYSFLYNHFGRDPHHLEVARKSAGFILRARPAGADTLWPVTLTREGQPRNPPATAIYGDLFVAEGLAEFARATGDRRYWDIAKELVLKCDRIYDRPDYEPDIVASYSGPPPMPFPGARIQGVSMVLLRVTGQMLDHRADPELQSLLDRSIDAVLNRHHNPAFDLNNELLSHDYSRPRNDLAQFVYTGHSIETLWMIVAEAVRTRNKPLFEKAAARFRRHVEVAWDRVYGGVFRSLNHVDRNLWALDKVLWEQGEVLTGCMLIYEHTGAPWAADIFTRMNDYVRAKYPLRPHGFSLWISEADRQVTFQPHTARVENYHHPRHLMMNLLALDRLIARRGKPSGLFA
jgi:N-acylglucosamine 2-epimerase